MEKGEVLVATLNNARDLELAREQHWYRIPVESVEKFLKGKNCWSPKWVAFYQTKVFNDEAYAIRYYAEVLKIRQVSRLELFPDEQDDTKRYQRYYKLELAPIQQLPSAIASPKLRRITFIPTTWAKFQQATDIRDL